MADSPLVFMGGYSVAAIAVGVALLLPERTRGLGVLIIVIAVVIALLWAALSFATLALSPIEGALR